MTTRLGSFLRCTRLLTLAAAVTAASALAVPAMADGLIVVKADLARPNPNSTNHYAYAPLSVISHKVKVSILGQLAVTEIEQEFYNDTDDSLEGEYIFPVPDGADIEKFSMDVNGVQTKADVIDKDAASRVYESIVRPPMGNGRDPALMEYAGRGMFKCRIFPLEAHKSKTVKISYTQMLKQKDGLLDYRYTLDTTKYSRKPVKNLSLAFTIDGAEPLTTLYSPTHMVDIKREEGTKATVSYKAEDIRPRNDFHLLIGRKATPVGLTAMTYRPKGQDEGYFVLMAAPSVDKTNVNLPKDVVFVVDTSGSMAGPKIRQARQALTTCISSLKANDRFDIVRFSTDVEPAFKTLQPVSDESRAKATAFIRSLAADGETALEPALKQALNERAVGKDGGGEDPNRLFMIVFLTDGEPTHGETNADKIVSEYVSNQKAANVRLFTFGLGSEVNTRLLDDLALNSHGSSNYVLENEDINQAVSSFFNKVQDPVLTNIKLSAENASVAGLYPNVMPDMFVGDQMVILGKYSKAGTFPVTLSGRSANGKELSFSDQIKFADSTDSANAWIGKLWATRRVGALLDQMRAGGGGGREDLKTEVCFLAKKFGIVTPYTAMIIVEQDQRARLPVAYHLLGDLENDKAAMLRTSSFLSALTAGKSVGDMALATSINTNSYREVSSLEQLARVVEQRESRLHDRTGADKGAMATLTKTRPELQVDWNQPGAREQYEKQLKELMETGARVYDNYAAQNQMVGDRTFFLTGDRWMDSSVTAAAAASKLEKIRFCSDAYFKLVRDHRELGPVVALGKNVTFEMAGVIYEISE